MRITKFTSQWERDREAEHMYYNTLRWVFIYPMEKATISNYIEASASVKANTFTPPLFLHFFSYSLLSLAFLKLLTWTLQLSSVVVAWVRLCSTPQSKASIRSRACPTPQHR